MAKVANSTDSSSLAEVVDRILDKGIVIDAWLKVSLVGIELLAVEARVVIASVETYLKYAEAIGLTAPAAAPALSRLVYSRWVPLRCFGIDPERHLASGQVASRAEPALTAARTHPFPVHSCNV